MRCARLSAIISAKVDSCIRVIDALFHGSSIGTMKQRTKVVAIIQARMGSARLPGKVLAPIRGRAMLGQVVERVRAAKTVDQIVVATSTEPRDDVILDFCHRYELAYFCGNERDVLDRFYHAAREFHADGVVRITSDCPLIDPALIDKTVRAFLTGRPHYASNCMVRTFPRGLDTEVVSFQALEIAWREASQSYQRAHVTPYIYENKGRFRILSVTGAIDYGAHRWTVDTAEDLEFVRAVYARLRGVLFSWEDVLDLLEREPQLVEMNRFVAQRTLHEG